MDDVAGDHETPQGTLQLGPVEVPAKGRKNRPRATLAASVRRRNAKQRPFDFQQTATELQLHQSVAQLLDWALLEPAFFTTFPAGWGKLTKGTAGRLYSCGLKKGMPDIMVFDSWCKVIGIELKTGKNDVTSAQRAMFAQLQAVGIRVYICRCQEDVIAALRDAAISHRKVSYDRGRDAEVYA